MNTNFQIGIITSYFGRPIDILLPIIAEDQFKRQIETNGHCFHIYSLKNTELLLFCKNDAMRRTLKIDICSACKANRDISIYVIRMNNDQLYLRAYTDELSNGIFPLPDNFYKLLMR